MPNRSKSLLIFSHGNSFPASTYGVMLHSLKERGFLSKSIEKLGHDARYPVTSNWPTSLRMKLKNPVSRLF